MKAVLFCMKPYAIGILEPLNRELLGRGYDVLWFAPPALAPALSNCAAPITSSILEVFEYRSDAIFAPGNDVPHYLHGVKVQVFHGLAGEKPSHFKIRDYFDLYCTQGPYFTHRFQKLARRHRNFEVCETGWCKLDVLYQGHEAHAAERAALLKTSGKTHVILYSPTFSPSLTSAIKAKRALFELADAEDIALVIKFHDLMNADVKRGYCAEAAMRGNVTIVEEPNVLKVMSMADLLISDTSSVVYEFSLLNKPVVTVDSRSANIGWRDVRDVRQLRASVMKELREDPFRDARMRIASQYHPYTDGRSSGRVADAAEDYCRRHGVPARRKLGLYRRSRINRRYGPEPR